MQKTVGSHELCWLEVGLDGAIFVSWLAFLLIGTLVCPCGGRYLSSGNELCSLGLRLFKAAL